MFAQLTTKITFLFSTEGKSTFVFAVCASMLVLLMLSEIGSSLKTFFTKSTGVVKIRMLVFDVFLQIFFAIKHHARAIKTLEFLRLIKSVFIQYIAFFSDGGQPTWTAHSLIEP